MERNGVINAIYHRRYDPEDFQEHSECVICYEPFKADDEVTPLPCNPAHYFHTECLKPWFQRNNTCPLCREVISADAFEQLR